MKILILRFSGFSELMMTTPLVRGVRTKYPNSEIHFLVKREYEHVLIHNSYINKVISFEGDLRDTVLLLLAEGYDVLIDLQNSLRSANVSAMLRQACNSHVKVYRANNMRARKFLLRNAGINFLPDRSVAEQFLRAGKKLGIVNDGQGFDYFIPEGEKIENSDLPMSHSAGYISFVLSNEKNVAKLSLVDWKALCKKIIYPIILQGGKDDEAMAEEIKKIDPIRIYNSCGKFSVNEQADIIRCAKVVVSNECDLMHIAAAYKRKIIALMQTGRPQLGRYPYYGFNNLKTTISPDSKLVVLKSKAGELSGINIDEVVTSVQHLLK